MDDCNHCNPFDMTGFFLVRLNTFDTDSTQYPHETVAFYLSSLTFMASKEQQLKDVRDFFSEMDHSIRKFQTKTVADNQYITMLLGALINDYRLKTPKISDFK